MADLLQFLTGDATRPVGDGNKIIAQVCNVAGRWGSDFMPAISRRWWQPEAEYRKWALRGSLKLGTVQLVPVRQGMFVANMFARLDSASPIRGNALLDCLKWLGLEAHQRQASIHLPRLGGNQWRQIASLLRNTLPGVRIFVYDLPR